MRRSTTNWPIWSVVSDLTSAQWFRLQRSKFSKVKHQFLGQMFFFNNFWSIGSRASILPQLCSSHQDESNGTQVDIKMWSSKFDLRSEVRSGQSRSWKKIAGRMNRLKFLRDCIAEQVLPASAPAQLKQNNKVRQFWRTWDYLCFATDNNVLSVNFYLYNKCLYFELFVFWWRFLETETSNT